MSAPSIPTSPRAGLPPPPSAPTTTCSAHAVDAALRGAFLGVMWGVATSPRATALRSAASSAVDFSAFLAIYSGCLCALERSSADATAGAVAGATASSFVCLRTRCSPRAFAATTAVSALFGAISSSFRHVLR